MDSPDAMEQQIPDTDAVRAVTLPGTERRDLRSGVLGRTLEISVKLPLSYSTSDARYPVLFCLDANRSFGLYSTMSDIFETPGLGGNQQVLLVGIGYRVDADRQQGLAEWAAWRTYDLTPEFDEGVERFWTERLSALMGYDFPVRSGGGPSFLKALRDEVFPFVEAHYRVSTTDRGLAGYSFGGLFVLYSLLCAPGLFGRCFAGSPTIWDRVFEYEREYAAAHDDLKARVLLSAGSLERDVCERMSRFEAQLRSRDYPQLDLETEVFAGEGHQSAYPAAASRALRVLYYDMTESA